MLLNVLFIEEYWKNYHGFHKIMLHNYFKHW